VTLEPARRAALAAAQAEAEQEVREAQREAGGRVAEAQEEARRLLDAARNRGRAAAEREAAETRSRIEAQARSRVMEARRAAYDRLCDEARRAALGLREDQVYPALLERLAETARDLLGPDAEIRYDPPTRGGVIARAGTRSVDLTLPALGARCLAGLGRDVARLWTE
jgi:vacuolar-type H+-ATPase subunit E/Vma4